MHIRHNGLVYSLGLPVGVYMVLFFVVPSTLLFIYSFWSASHFVITPDFTFENYLDALNSPVFQKLTLNGVVIGISSGLICLLLAIPLAYFQVFVARTHIIFGLVVTTWFASYLVRIYSWRSLLGTSGLINTFLLETGVIDQPLDALLFNPFAVTLTLIHIWLPVATLMIMAAFSDISRDLLDAARDLGSRPFGTFIRVVFPNASNGILGAFMLTFILSAGDYVTPQMLGGTSGQTTGLMIANQFRKTGDWPGGAAQAILMFLIAAALYYLLLKGGRMLQIIPQRPVRR